MRNIFIETLVELAKENDKIFLITPDLGYSVLEKFRDKYPNRFLNVGIAEANAIGIAAGLALSGKIVYVYSIIPFVTMRPFEQIRVDVAYMNLNVRLVGVGAGFSYGQAGATHHAIEDLGIMRCLPNMTVLSPATSQETKKLTQQTLNYKGPIYMRLGRDNNLKSDLTHTIKIGEPSYFIKHNQSEIVIFFTGNTLDLALEIYEFLKNQEIQIDLISMHSLKPCDKKAFLKIIDTKKYIFSIEEHNIIGGLGSLIAEYLAESNLNCIFKRFGVEDSYSHFVGDQKYIRSRMGLTRENIVNQILEIYHQGKVNQIK